MELEYPGNYRLALSEARARFRLLDPRTAAVFSGAGYDTRTSNFTLLYCADEYTISYPDGNISRPNGGKIIPPSDQVLLLLYLAQASGMPLREEWLSFNQLPGGPHHYQLFWREAVNPLAEAFGTCPESLVEAAARIGGRPWPVGDAGAIIEVLPRVPLAVALWTPDEEFPSRATILFDSSASTHLDTAGLFVLGINTGLKLRLQIESV